VEPRDPAVFDVDAVEDDCFGRGLTVVHRPSRAPKRAMI
jgi:hypothetical protein